MVAATEEGWPRLFATAFKQSRNAMVLLDEHRVVVDVNGAYLAMLGLRREALIGRPVYESFVDGPAATPAVWAATLAQKEFVGEREMRVADGSTVGVQWAATVERVTGRRLVLFVVLSTSRWGGRLRPVAVPEQPQGDLTDREREIIGLVALGHSGPEIAGELHIAHDTVRTHIRNAMTKLGARSRAQLVAKSLGGGHVHTGP